MVKSQLRTVQHGVFRYQVLAFICPGCQRADSGGPIGSGLHMLPVNTDKKNPSWDFDGNLEAPTISPSILTTTGPMEPDGSRDPSKQHVCHSYLRAGVFEFLDDCTHDLKGQKVPIPDLPDWVTREGN